MVKKTDLPAMLEQQYVKEKKQRRNTIFYLGLLLLAGLALTLWTFFQAQKLNGYIAEIADKELQLKELDIQLEEVNNAIELQKQTSPDLLEAMNETYEPLQPPTPEYPKSGRPIPMPRQNNFFYFQWSPVENASNYSLEVDCHGCGQPGEWYSLSGSPWHIRSGLGFRSTIYSSWVHLNSGCHSLRWRVWASDSEGREGRKSAWIYFAFSAQLPTATIRGVVKDVSGTVVPDAFVTVRNAETSQRRSAFTAGDGSYRFPSLPVGSYEVRVEHPGFYSGVRRQGLTPGQEAFVDLVLARIIHKRPRVGFVEM